MIATFLDVFLIAAGPFVGSFITASSRTWPDWARIACGRSACSQCGRKLPPWELIPIVSYLVQRGRCSACGTRIPTLHPVGEVCAFAIAIIAVLAFDGGWTLAAAIFGWVLLFGALVDLRTFLLPDVVTLGLIPAGLALAYLADGPSGLFQAAIAAAAGFTSLALIAWAYRQLRGRDGLGLGDAKLLAAGGAWTGPFALPWIVAIGAGATLFIVVIAHILGRKTAAETEIPLGPGLAAGCFLAYSLPDLIQAAV